MWGQSAVTEWSDAANWLDILDHIWIGLVLIIIALIPVVYSNRKGIKKIQDQVVNGHKDSPPLRADLDKVMATIAQIDSKVDSISHTVASIRSDLVEEENRRRASIKELRDDLDHRLDSMKTCCNKRRGD